MKTSGTYATAVGVHVQTANSGADDVRITMVGDNGTGLAFMDMTPNVARRHALRILQTCELAEGKPPVNA
jgi:hypothetical protein